MILAHKYLPYELRQTACQLFAGKTGFNQAEIKAFFTEEVGKRVPQTSPTFNTNTFFGAVGAALEAAEYSRQLNRDTFTRRADAFDYWLSLLPLEDQKELLLMLCRKPYFPMRYGVPSAAQRNRLAAMLTEFVIEATVSAALQRLDSTFILQTWEKAMDRCEDDPQGAFTAMRTLLESVCKHLLDMLSITYGEHDDLPRLYFLLAQALQIAPNQQSDPALRQIFGGCNSVVNGLGALRNQLGDAHGQGKTGMVPASYHAKFAVNLAGAAVLFLVQAWEAYQETNLHAVEA